MIALLLVLAAPLADTLRLGPGIHPGPLVITRPTVVLGAPGAVLRGTGAGTVLDIRAAGTLVRGLRIETSGADHDRYDAGVRIDADSVTLEALVLRDVLFGVYVHEARAAVLRGLDIEGRPARRESGRGDGIYLYHAPDVLAEGNRIAGVRDGIFFSYSDGAVVRDNRVARVRFGLHYMYSHHNRFERNVFTDNAAGAVIMFSNGLEIVDNVFAWNAGSRSYGLVLQQTTEPVVRGNLLVGNGIGVFFDNVIRGDFTDNVIAGNWLGLELFANSEETRVTGNAVLGNTFDAAGGGGPGHYRYCVAGRGNYWDRAAGTARDYDLDRDGVLDAPYQAASPLAELARGREGLRLFLHSPAARSLEWAERTFPVFDVRGAVDDCPLSKAPRPPALASLPAAPAARAGGATGQATAAALAMLVGLAVLATGRRRT